MWATRDPGQKSRRETVVPLSVSTEVMKRTYVKSCCHRSTKSLKHQHEMVDLSWDIYNYVVLTVSSKKVGWLNVDPKLTHRLLLSIVIVRSKLQQRTRGWKHCAHYIFKSFYNSVLNYSPSVKLIFLWYTACFAWILMNGTKHRLFNDWISFWCLLRLWTGSVYWTCIWGQVISGSYTEIRVDDVRIYSFLHNDS